MICWLRRKQQNRRLPSVLNKLAAQHPESSEVQESLGYLDWQQGNVSKAEECFKLSIDRGSKNPEMMTHYASLLSDGGASAEQLLPVLRKVVEIDPEYPEGWLQLGTTATRCGSISSGAGGFCCMSRT